MRDMTEEILFADTYALIEMIKGGVNYRDYLTINIVTTKFNLIELYYNLLHDFNKRVADKYFEFYAGFMIPISVSSIKIGMEFKLTHKKEKLSYVDCIGYALALERGIMFLTGDEKFRNKENVEFVK